jgi:nicotinate-nucleotide pyrophosphorylase (carboxylating)
MNKVALTEQLKRFLNEDIGYLDVTSSAIFTESDEGTGEFVAKADGILAGAEIIQLGYHLLDPDIKVELPAQDGDHVSAQQVIAKVSGKVIPLLSGERVILNLVQRLSGIATTTTQIIELLADPTIRICDTRKTTPGLRMLEKYAVRTGGGYNHRYGLDDAVLIKDNHIAHAGSITAAVERVRAKYGHMLKIEVETENLEQVREAINVRVDVIMLDNCSPEEAKIYTALIPPEIITELSGGINTGNIADYRGCGVNYISLGMLTHSVKALDISFNLAGGNKYGTTN